MEIEFLHFMHALHLHLLLLLEYSCGVVYKEKRSLPALYYFFLQLLY